VRHCAADSDLRARASLYSLGALSQSEARAFETHLLEDCRVCEDELCEFNKVIGALGFAARDAMPDSRLRAELLDRIGMESQFRVSSAVRHAFGRRMKRVITGSVSLFRRHRGDCSLDSGVSPRLARTPRDDVAEANPWMLRLAIVGSLALAGLVAIQALRAIWAAKQLEIKQASLISLVASLKDENEAAAATARETQQIRAALRSLGVSTGTLESQQPAPPSSAEIYWNRRDQRCVVTANLKPTPEGKVYQLWFITGTAKVSLGLIEVDSDGRGCSVLQVPPRVDRVDAAAITLEPDGGSSQPTMPIYAIGALRQP
jgi:anti-sigma-K factor RskA